ncbi:MAG: OB-fold nucleic acid binding domain-containing protein [Methanocella sp.]
MQKEELAVIVLLLFAAVAACVLVLVTGEAPGAQYSGASKPGDTVVLEGLLVHKEETGSGGHLLLTVKAGPELVKVFVNARSSALDVAAAASPGSMLSVRGEVQEYKGGREVVASSISIQ